MTTYLLVPGMHTGGWVWQDVAGRLREAGARAEPVTLTGLGAGAAPAGPGTDLAAHVEEVVALIDAAAAADGGGAADPAAPAAPADIVLVGHCYGARVAAGAADRRPARVARLVLVDTAPAGDGDTALALLPGAAGSGGAPLPAPPSPDGWQRLGSTAGVPAEALARLTHEATAQPPGTLTQPLRLSGAGGRLPATGVLCTGNGPGIDTVEALVRMGDPRFRPLADPRLTYFELATGHWPMLSSPGGLTEVLLRAAAGEGHRMTAAARQPPPHLAEFLLDVPAQRPRERLGRVDVYRPATEQPRPAVVFVHGGPVHPELRPTPRDWPAFIGYGRYAASLGAIGVTLDHRLYGVGDFGRAADDVAEAVALVRADPLVDADRIALWCFSVGGLLAADWLAAPPPWLRCVALSYPMLAPLPNWGHGGDSRFRPAVAVRGAGRLPVVLTRVERERPEIAATVAEFAAEATRCGADLTVIDVPGGRHGFETADHTQPAREAVRRAMRTVLGRLAD
ncbi:alpha/beta fold hydrolase [Streptomyces sp. V4-01]|uniref:Alpha/beta fold hydrolase n=1 Tax=Actinacidiphila polyblastidii TaxID=3110430 RepID=A0ABU7PD11_9ACTN|nr:alpha/beta fold hydrolase [Streptomyces sp. V4-01]